MIFFHLELTPAKKNLTRLSCLSSRCPTLTPCVRLLNYTSVVMAAITEDTYKEKASFVFFYYIKIQKFERKFLYGTKHWKWYGDMNMTLLSYSHRLSTGVAPGSRLWPWSLCVVFVLFFFSFTRLQMVTAFWLGCFLASCFVQVYFARRRNERSAK